MDNFLWFEKYRPKTLDECILPKNLKTTLKSFVEDKGTIVNAIFSGPPGIGKTTAALAVCKELGAEYLFLNGSGEDRGIDTVRNKILNFATKASILSDVDTRKMIIFDEAENITSDGQMALRSTIEEVSRNCGFILTCNYKHKIIDPIHSRCQNFDFSIPREEKNDLMKEFIKRSIYILKKENIENIEQKSIIELVKRFFPDYRKIINSLQSYSSTGSIDTGILTFVADSDLDSLIEILQNKSFNKMRKWVAELSVEPIDIILSLYKHIDKYIIESSLPQCLVYLHEGQKDDVIAIDKQLSLTATLTKLMHDCEFKK